MAIAFRDIFHSTEGVGMPGESNTGRGTGGRGEGRKCELAGPKPRTGLLQRAEGDLNAAVLRLACGGAVGGNWVIRAGTG
ncbi:hypothetical protein D3C76_1648260 [compost metagenome]